jgi:hypothetical protein
MFSEAMEIRRKQGKMYNHARKLNRVPVTVSRAKEKLQHWTACPMRNDRLNSSK